MNEERRETGRCPSFTVMDLITRDGQGGERSHLIMTRDTSSSGIGGVYIGQEPIDTEGELFLKDTENVVRKVRLAWVERTADYVFLLGFEVLSA